jgi:hypothetical protein
MKESEQYFCCKEQINQRCSEQCLGCFQFEHREMKEKPKRDEDNKRN